MFTSPTLTLYPNLAHGFLTRQGGVSKGDYSSLNCDYRKDDLVSNVTTNRQIALKRLGSQDASLLICVQTHSTKVITVSEPFTQAPEADGMVTDTPQIALGILTADCGPVLFYEPQSQVIGACHSGWRGALEGINQETVEAMCALGAIRHAIRAVIGPCIGVDSYEVGPDFYDHFMTRNAQNASFFKEGHDTSHKYFDLRSFITHQLQQAGLKHIDHVDIDTYTNPKLFFSYRHKTKLGNKALGNQLSAILLR